MFTNCRRVELVDVVEDNEMLLEEGWVGVEPDRVTMRFRPTRGSGGFAVYSTEAQALRQTECTEAAKVSLVLRVEKEKT